MLSRKMPDFSGVAYSSKVYKAEEFQGSHRTSKNINSNILVATRIFLHSEEDKIFIK
jgi:hypothetical protein